MGIFSSFFMSESEKAKLERAKKRRIVRGVERIIENMEERSARLHQECTALWAKAGQQLRSGMKTDAAATLRVYKAANVMSEQMERRLTVARHRYGAIAGAADMQEVMSALSTLAGTIDVDVEALEDTMDQISDAACENSEVSRIIDAAFRKDMADLDREAQEGSDGADDELFKALEREVSGETGASSAGIRAGQERLQSILDRKK